MREKILALVPRSKATRLATDHEALLEAQGLATRQAATTDVMQPISRSATDLPSVLESGNVWGGNMLVVASWGAVREAFADMLLAQCHLKCPVVLKSVAQLFVCRHSFVDERQRNSCVINFRGI